MGMLLVGFLVFLFVGLRMSLIVMTAIPLSIDAARRDALGPAIIGGLALATVLTLVIVPVLYSLIAREESQAEKDRVSF